MMHTRILPRLVPMPALSPLPLFARLQSAAAATYPIARMTFVLRRSSLRITDLAVQRRLAQIDRRVARVVNKKARN